MSAQFPGYDDLAILPSLMPPSGGFSPEQERALYEAYMPFGMYQSAGVNPIYNWVHPIDRLGPDSPLPFQRMPDGSTYIPDFMYEAMREGRIRQARGPYASQGRALMDAMGVEAPVPQDRYGYEAVPAW